MLGDFPLRPPRERGRVPFFPSKKDSTASYLANETQKAYNTAESSRIHCMRSRLHQHRRGFIFKKLAKIFGYVVCILFLAACFFFLLAYSYINARKIESLQKQVDELESHDAAELANTCHIKDSLSTIRKSIVRIIGGEAEGSGFAVAPDTILTNFHVIQFDESPKVVLPDNTFRTAQIILSDKDADLAFLKIDARLPMLTLADSDPLMQTDELYSMGFPFGGELQGELTVKKGILAGRRVLNETGEEFLQTDSTLNPGVSGGPMTNNCGRVVGINTLGGSGMGFAIASTSISKKWHEMAISGKDPLKDITVLDIQPDVDQQHAVEAYYDYIKLRRLDKAFALLGDDKKDFTFENWKKGYNPNLDTSVLSTSEDDADKNKIHVKLTTKDLVDGEIVYKYFEGYWIVKKVTTKFLLQEAHIKEVKNPDYSWFE
jgi:hypothetical protein